MWSTSSGMSRLVTKRLWGLGASFASRCVRRSTLRAVGNKDALSVGSVCLVLSKQERALVGPFNVFCPSLARVSFFLERQTGVPNQRQTHVRAGQILVWELPDPLLGEVLTL